jgi:hypothetical protein
VELVAHAVEWQMRRGSEGAAETLRPWLQDLDWGWKRAKVAARDAAPQRVEKFARLRLACEQLRAGMALCFAEEVDLKLFPKGGD